MEFACRSSPEQGLCSAGCSNRWSSGSWGGSCCHPTSPRPMFWGSGCPENSPQELQGVAEGPSQLQEHPPTATQPGQAKLSLFLPELKPGCQALQLSHEIEPWGRQVKSHHQVLSDYLCPRELRAAPRHLPYHGKHEAALSPCSQRSVHAMLQADKGAALGMGTEGFAVVRCPLSPRALSWVRGEGVRCLPCQPHGMGGGGLQSRSNPSPRSFFSSHGPGSSSRTWARAQRPSGRASPADWELHGFTREVAFVRCLQGFWKMKGHGPACPSVWIKPHISPLGV